MKKLALLGAIIVSATAIPALAAPTLYGYDSDGPLITINQGTAMTSLVGNASGTRVGLARSTATGITYTRSFNTLYSVNLSTGANTALGASGTFLTGLAFNSAQTTLYSIDQGTNALYSVSLVNGAATLIGSTSVTSTTLLDLATNPAGAVYAAAVDGSIFTINTTTGTATFVSRLVTEGLTAIEFASNGDLYGVGFSDTLYRGVLTGPVAVGVLNPRFFDVRGLEFVDLTSGVPEPATWAMMMLGFGGMGYAMRRRQKVSTRIRFA